MCGITAQLNILKHSNIKENTCKSIKQLENRGYDSVGFFFEGHPLLKSIAKISQFEKELQDLEIESHVSMAHTRWATHGGVCQKNSHPHISFDQNIIIVHNGIINNFKEWKTLLESKDIRSNSDTDTEVIANLLRYNEINNPSLPFTDIIKKTMKQLEGTWGLVIYNKKHPHSLFTTCNGCPVLIGYNSIKTRFMISSEKSGFSDLVDYYFILKEKQVEQINVVSNKIKTSFQIQEQKLFSIQHNDTDDSPYPYPHWTLKEIHEQPHKIEQWIENHISKTSGLIDMNIENKTFSWNEIKHITFIGCGTSLHSSMLGVHYMKELCRFVTVQAIDASEFTEHDIPRSKHNLFIFVSQSGETKDVHHVLKIIQSYRFPTMSIINVEDSLIARESDYVIYTKAGKEYGVASTKCFTLQVITMLSLSLYISQKQFNIDIKTHKEYIQSIIKLPNQIKQMIDQIETKDKHRLIEQLNQKTMIVLGRGKTYPIAKEGALKIKEISYIHSEAFASGSLKHGPLALMDKTLPVFLIKTNDNTLERMNHAHQEIIARGTHVVVVGNDMKENNINHNTTHIFIPFNEHCNELLSIIPFQLFAYYLALENKNDPDFPRNLAKSVVVY